MEKAFKHQVGTMVYAVKMSGMRKAMIIHGTVTATTLTAYEFGTSLRYKIKCLDGKVWKIDSGCVFSKLPDALQMITGVFNS